MAERTATRADTRTFIGDARRLDEFSTWLDDFTRAVTARVIDNHGRESFNVDIVALNRLLPTAIDHAPCCNVVLAQEFVGLTANLNKRVAAVVAALRQPLGLAEGASDADVAALQEELRFTVPYLQNLGARLRSERKRASRAEDSGTDHRASTEGVAATGATRPPAYPNYDRDKQIYESRVSGKTWKEIAAILRQRPEWDSITDGGIRNAARVYADRCSLPVLPRGKSGRPNATK